MVVVVVVSALVVAGVVLLCSSVISVTKSVVVGNSSDMCPNCVTGWAVLVISSWEHFYVYNAYEDALVLICFNTIGMVGSPMMPVRVTAIANSATDWLGGATSSERLTVSSSSEGGAGVSMP